MLHAKHSLLLALVVSACIKSTPFDVDVTVRDRTQQNLDALSRRTPGRAFKVAAIGDIHDEYDDLVRTVDAINARGDVDLVAVAGDMSDLGLREELEWSRAILDRLRMPYFTAIGNHDAVSSGKTVYRRMYGPFDYRFRFGGSEFVFYNSNALEFPGEPVPNFSWLDAQLSAATDASNLVLVTHHPPVFPPKQPEGDYDAAEYARLFDKHPIALVIQSHLTEWQLTTRGAATILQCGTYRVNRLHTIITIEGRALSFERCRFDDCTSVSPTEGS